MSRLKGGGSKTISSTQAPDPTLASSPQSDSVPPIGLGGESKRISRNYRWGPVPITNLPHGNAKVCDWIWEDLIARGAVTLLSATWKVGKTTLLSNLLRESCKDAGEFCGRELDLNRCLIISEESQIHWARRQEESGFNETLHLQSQPFVSQPTTKEWEVMVADIACSIREEEFDLVILDSLFSLWPVKDENDAAQVKGALLPLNQLTALGAGVLLVAHSSKAEAARGSSFRGSGALGACVDIIVEMRRCGSSTGSDRELSVIGRYKRCEPLILRFEEPEGYSYAGSRKEWADDKWCSQIRSQLEQENGAQTFEEVAGKLKSAGGQKLGSGKLKRILNKMVEDGFVDRRGEGKKGDPHRYSLLDKKNSMQFTPKPIGENQIESEEASERGCS